MRWQSEWEADLEEILLKSWSVWRDEGLLGIMGEVEYLVRTQRMYLLRLSEWVGMK